MPPYKMFRPLLTDNSSQGAYIMSVNHLNRFWQRTQFSFARERSKMKTRSNLCTVALAVGILAVVSAQAGSGLIKITHSGTPCRGGCQIVPSIVAKAQPAVSETKASEVQVAVMANLPSQPAARRSVYIHR
jgi:hypothetical protein